MFGDNSREALGLTLNYNKPPDYNKRLDYNKLQTFDRISRFHGAKSMLRSDMATTLEITAPEVHRRLEAGEALTLIDVREPEEHQICRIDGATLIPMRQIPKQFEHLEGAAAPLVVFCHHGVRSLNVVEWLREQGITDCLSMAGGIDAWSREVDPGVPRY